MDIKAGKVRWVSTYKALGKLTDTSPVWDENFVIFGNGSNLVETNGEMGSFFGFRNFPNIFLGFQIDSFYVSESVFGSLRKYF